MKFKVSGVRDQPILPVIFNIDPVRLGTIGAKMKKRGFMVGSVSAPACPIKEPRLRVTCTSILDYQVMDEFVKTLVNVAENTHSEDLKTLSLIM